MPQLTESIDFMRALGANVIGYIRVSTEEQLENNSLPEQAREIDEWCRKKGFNLIAIYFDRGISGSKLAERDGLLAAIQRCKRDPDVDAIAFFNFDRYFRDLGYSEVIRKTLQGAGKRIYSTQQDVDLDDMYGVFTFQVMQSVSELQRKQIVKLLYARRMAKGAKGGWIGGRIPYGKRLEEGQLVDHPADRRNVRLIRRLRKWVHNGPGGREATQQWIAYYMNCKMALYCPLDRSNYDREVGVPLHPEYGPKHIQKNLRQRHRPYKRPKRGFWTRSMVQGILRDEDSVSRLFTREREAPATRNTSGSYTTASAQPFAARSRVS